MSILSGLPDWAQAILAWLSTGSNIASLLAVIAALVKLGGIKSENRSITNMQIDLLNKMVGKLDDTSTLAGNVQSVSEQMAESLSFFENAISTQKQSNANLATFVMECFSRSNLRDEDKADLKILADKIFYDDNTQVIEALKQAKLAADNALSDCKAEIAQLKADLEAEKLKLQQAQENTKVNRRV